MSIPSHLPVDYTAGSSGHIAAHEATNIAINALEDAISELQAGGAGDGLTSSDAVDAISAAINTGTHTGLTCSVNSATGGLNLALTTPVIVLPVGASVPAGTPVGAVILRTAS